MRYATIAFALIATTAHAQTATTLREPPADHSGTYFCKATAAGGLRYDKNVKVWSSTTFDVTDSTYTVKVSTNGQIDEGDMGWKSRAYTVTVKKFGSEVDPSPCIGRTKPFREVVTFGDRLECRFLGSTYLFDLKQNRYMINFEGGFLSDTGDNFDTPYVEGGKCDKIN